MLEVPRGPISTPLCSTFGKSRHWATSTTLPDRPQGLRAPRGRVAWSEVRAVLPIRLPSLGDSAQGFAGLPHLGYSWQQPMGRNRFPGREGSCGSWAGGAAGAAASSPALGGQGPLQFPPVVLKLSVKSEWNWLIFFSSSPKIRCHLWEFKPLVSL